MEKQNMRKFAVIGLVAVVSACSNPQDATEKNFKAAIQSYLNAEYPKCYFHGNFPTELSDFGFDKNKYNIFHALAEAKLLSEKEVSRKEFDSLFGLNQKETKVTYAYNLTAEGQKYYQPEVIKTWGGEKVGGFCLGSAKINSIVQFSEPADMFGNRVSRVSYTYSVADLPAWVTAEDVVVLDKKLKEDVDSRNAPIKETKAMILTNNGWIHEGLYEN
jgi:hypothetical protein